MNISNISKDTTLDPTWVYTSMVGYHPSSLVLALTGHFLVEYLMDKITFARCKNAKKISNYSFSIKLEFLNSMNLLSDDLYKNIKNLNQIRNEIAHTLKVNLKNRNFYKSSGQKIIIKSPRSGDPERFYLKMLSYGILGDLRNYMLLDLKVSPDCAFEL